MPDDRLSERALTVAEAFAGLPHEQPERSAWPLLEQRIAASRPLRRARWPFLLATAAVLAMAALIPRMMTVPLSPPEATLAAVDSPSLNALMSESARLEHFITRVANDDVSSANATLLSLELEDRMQQLDSRLTDPTLDKASRQALWQRRVSLLREYAGLQGTTQWLSAQGKTLDGALVATF